MTASDEEAKERCIAAFSEEKTTVKRFIYQRKKKVNEEFGRKTNENVKGNRKLFWKKVSNVKGGKMESCSKIKNINGRLAQREVEVGRIWKECFENLYNIGTQDSER